MSKKLLLDLGNSRLKWAVLDAAGRHDGEPVAHTHAGLGDLTAMRTAARGAQGAWISSTAHSLTQGLIDAVAQTLRCPTNVYASPKEDLGIRSAYDLPHTLGTDRFLAMAGVRAQRSGPFLLVDAGTAMTIDLVDEGGQHLGGLIVPGPALMRDALHRGTAGIRTGEAPRLREFARSTDDAVWSGGCLACVALVGHAWRHAAMGVGAEVELLLTGGALPLLETHLSLPHQRLANPVLDGLALWARAAGGP
ncbi:MAG: type III pantothenate kinase [Xanthomonadales bacterium]|nr:Type III pantothenate kinase [Xanthomonadales bacterium]MCC6592102.1 type III pantothenate kinase [Xanthomonadales bacterium]MCE7932316.1 type III pantothenate kinase [Xanthomonadales bacterium PRO6]